MLFTVTVLGFSLGAAPALPPWNRPWLFILTRKITHWRCTSLCLFDRLSVSCEIC